MTITSKQFQPYGLEGGSSGGWRRGLGVQDIQSLLTILKSSDDVDLVAQATRTTAALELSLGAWHEVAELLGERLDGNPSSSVVTAAAHIPVLSVREQVRAISTADDELGRAATSGLYEVLDTPTITNNVAKLIAQGDWQPVASLPMEAFEQIDLGNGVGGPDAEPWLSIAHAKAGNVAPLIRLLRLIERDQGPSLFWGDPMYVSSLLEVARPVPSVAQLALKAELDDIDQVADSRRFNEVAILVEGLIGTESGFW